MKYTINYGCGKAILYTPYDCKQRFYTLANTCFGIRKNITCCNVVKVESTKCKDFERLEFSGDIYVWDKYGRRKMIEPMTESEWDDSYCDECRYVVEGTPMTLEAVWFNSDKEVFTNII